MKDIPSDPTDREALAHVERVVRSSGSSFFSAMRMLPRKKRTDMYAIYAFCREVDDIADDPGEEKEKRGRLGEWRNEIELLFAGHPTGPVSRALARPVADHALRKEDFIALIDGMDMDAGDTLRMVDMDHLYLYCDRVACAVGRLSYRVFGADAESGDDVARFLGQALQLTNILRDLDEDVSRDRLYLPADLLAAHGIAETDLQAVLSHPNLEIVCKQLASIADQRYGEASAALARCDRRVMRPAIIMMKVYRRIFDKLRARGWGSDRRPVKVSKIEKLWIALRHGVF